MTCGITNAVKNETIKSVLQFFPCSSLYFAFLICLSPSHFVALLYVCFFLFALVQPSPLLIFIPFSFSFICSHKISTPPPPHLFSLAASLSLSIFPPLSPPFVLLDLSFFFCSQSEVIILFISASNTTFFLFYLVKWMIKGS